MCPKFEIYLKGSELEVSFIMKDTNVTTLYIININYIYSRRVKINEVDSIKKIPVAFVKLLKEEFHKLT